MEAKINLRLCQLVMLFFMLIPKTVFADIQPILLFSDLITGPGTGLGDSKGSGVIVTVWGQNLGSKQSASTIEFCDSSATCRAGYVYYWKNADGQSSMAKQG